MRARPVLPNKTYMVTRRCVRRRLLLRPSEDLNRVILYLLGVACLRFGVLLHAACFMGNHLHLVVTDVRGELPEFCRYLFEFLAKCVNVLLGRFETVFAQGSYSRVELLDEKAVLDKIVYTLANPVAAALVPHGSEWPGVRLGPGEADGGSGGIPADRPTVFFSAQGKAPGSALLTLSKPPVFMHLGDAEYLALVQGALEAREESWRQEILSQGRTFLGREKVLAQDPESTPWTPEELRTLDPTVATTDRWRCQEALEQRRVWHEAYRKALEAFLAGDHTVEFPAGTYWMVRHAGAKQRAPT